MAEESRTCGTCGNYDHASCLCRVQGMSTFPSWYCEVNAWIPVESELDQLDQRCYQLEQLIIDMWHYVVSHNTPDVPGVDMSVFEDQLAALGVSVDG